MTNTRKYLLAGGLAVALTVLSAGSAAAGHGANESALPSGIECLNTDGDAHAEGLAAGSPGVLSGNLIQIPVNLEANVCGNTIDIVGLLNPASGGGGGGNNGGGNNGGGNNGGGNNGGGSGNNGGGGNSSGGNN
ncbi:chaplin [Kitasatospora sp. NPDC057518]|uniref:chaplin n=1 Tax=Kitasatospora sp. NPDC057518 TaxID=3346155 RepID=UPI003680EB08